MQHCGGKLTVQAVVCCGRKLIVQASSFLVAGSSLRWFAFHLIMAGAHITFHFNAYAGACVSLC